MKHISAEVKRIKGGENGLNEVWTEFDLGLIKLN